MEWMKIIGDSVQFIEEHLTDDLSVDEIAKAVNVSPFYFQKGFAMRCRMSTPVFSPSGFRPSKTTSLPPVTA